MKNQVNVTSIKSLKVRNWIRGMLSNGNPSEMRASLAKIAQHGTEEDFKRSLEILRGSLIFRSNGLSRYFLKRFTRPLVGLPFTEAEIVERFNENKAKIVKLTRMAEETVFLLVRREHEQAFEKIIEVAASEGVSLFLLRLIYLVKNRATRSDISRRADALLEEIQVGNVRYLQLAIRELSSPNTEYLNIRDKVSAAAEDGIAAIAKSLVDHVPRSNEQFIETLNAYFGLSLFDAYLYYCSVSRLELFGNESKLDGTIMAAFRSMASLYFPVCYSETDDAGLEYFRDAFLLIELDCCFEYRTAYCALYNNVEDKEFRRMPLERVIVEKYFGNITRLQDVIDFGSQYSGAEQPSFQRSNALIYFLEKNDGNIDDEKCFVTLMSSTRDVGIICPKRHLISMTQNARSDEFKLVVGCLAYIKSRTQSNEHELRRIIQEITLQRFDASLVRLLAHLQTISPAVTEHLIQAVDETFLSKMFQLVSKPNAAIEKRAEVFDWYGHLIGDNSYLERAKNLRIDVQISREKGTIDDSRIYVDPVKFTQWVNDNLVDELTILLASICSSSEPTVPALNWDKVKAGMTEMEQVGAILWLAYDEFCTNKKFGIASYIGRRIRHGTLKGTGFNDIRQFAARDSFASLFSNHEFAESFGRWLNDYEACLDDLRDRYIQIQDKVKPEGLITRDLWSPGKKVTANHMVFDVLKSFYHNKSGQEIPYIVTEYCWRLIEEDLAIIRRFIMDKKAKHGVFLLESSKHAKSRQREMQDFCQELNALIAERFRIIESWFNKPSIASPSAELTLLFRAVVSEIRGFFADFTPVLHIDEPGYIIRGGVYFVIYDALFIIIYNAARYGKKQGELKFGVTIKERASAVHFHISITSEISTEEDPETARYSIQSALEGDCEDALITEGRSGIKKLRRMEQDGYIRHVNYAFEERKITATFEFVVDYQS